MPLMTECQLAPATPTPRSTSFWDPSSGARLELHTPANRPDLWCRYVNGLTQAYRRYGVEAALDLNSFRSGASTSLFLVALGSANAVVAGARMHGPLHDAADAHALHEFAENPESVAIIGQQINDRLPFGVIEMKGGWVAPGVQQRNELSNLLARSFLHAMTLLNVQFAFGTAATHATTRWRTTGARPAEGVVPVPYPDDRYETTLMWWDFTRLSELAEPAQLRRFRGEASLIAAGGTSPAVPNPRVAHE